MAEEEESSSEERVAYVTPVSDEEEERGLTPEQCLADIRNWIETEAEFYGRTDDEFLRMFLFGCKFNLENMKKKMCKYYDNRRKLPQWWTNRDLKDPELLSILKLRTTVVLKDQGPNYPAILLYKWSNFQEALDAKGLDLWLKIGGANMELIMRRVGAQVMGMHCFIDASGLPLWLFTKLLSPIFVRDIINSFLLALPLRVKSITLVNSPLIMNAVWTLARPFLTRKLRNRVHFYRSDRTQLLQNIDRDCVPEEYGGNAGPLALHEEAYIEELLSHTEFFSEDDQYGYQTDE